MTRLVLPALLLCGCLAIPNPWFVLDIDTDDSGRPGLPSTSETPTSTENPSVTTSTGSQPGTTSSTGSSTEPSLPTSGEDVSTSTSSSSSSESSSEGTGLASSSSDSSTGDVGEALFDLYLLCPENGVSWLGGAALNIPRQCNRGDLPGVSQIPNLDVDGMNEKSILNISPSMEPMGAMEGIFPLGSLDPDQAMVAKVVAKVHCPASPDPQKPCSATAKIEARVFNNPVGAAQTSLGDGSSDLLWLDLSLIPEILEGQKFEIVLHVDVGEVSGPFDRVYFIEPRLTL